ncbi:MAG: VIT1/CCC1 transporter family protein [Deltaproteobacteria bacterium]|nr:VIT1/CCC1 transporter family protein [Deltaproteobacteria bacterium]
MADLTERHHHEEWHTPKGRAIREIIFGMNDGLVTTVGFLAGVTSSISEGRFILLAGIAEIAAGAISMSMGAYLATKSQREFFHSEIEREKWEIEKMPEKEAQEVREIYGAMGFNRSELDMIVKRVTSNKDLLLRFMKREELGLIDEHLDEPLQVALIMGCSFLVGSLPPILPYFFMNSPHSAIWVAILFSVFFLFFAGVAKTRLTKVKPLRSGLETMVLGVFASGLGYGLGWLAGKII